ncbi:MAG: hypothetical protein LAO31_09605 [Acidobacteriia bacterium]|nr:hypothetical protein [Terriglobia bacterium]
MSSIHRFCIPGAVRGMTSSSQARPSPRDERGARRTLPTTRAKLSTLNSPLWNPMLNYFNYFTEVEEYFQQKRGAGMLLSTLDWALIDTWREAEIPLEIIFRGIDATFDKWNKRRVKTRRINGLAYCLQEVMTAYEEHKEAAVGKGSSTVQAAREELFSPQELKSFFEGVRASIKAAAESLQGQSPGAHGAPSDGTEESTIPRVEDPQALAGDLDKLVSSLEHLEQEFLPEGSFPGIDFEQLERRLGAVEEKMLSAIKNAIDDRTLADLEAEADHALAPYRQNMRAEMIQNLRKQFMHKRLREHWSLPRLSLFHLQ